MRCSRPAGRPARLPCADRSGLPRAVHVSSSSGLRSRSRDTANRSSASRTANNSSKSRPEYVVTRTPFRGRCSTNPCSASSRRASRSGARLIRNRWVSCSSTSRSPGSSAPDRISARSRVVASSTRLRGCNMSLDSASVSSASRPAGPRFLVMRAVCRPGRPNLPETRRTSDLQSRRRIASPTRHRGAQRLVRRKHRLPCVSNLPAVSLRSDATADRRRSGRRAVDDPSVHFGGHSQPQGRSGDRRPGGRNRVHQKCTTRHTETGRRPLTCSFVRHQGLEPRTR